VRAAEDHGVDLCLAQGRDVLAHGVHDGVVDGAPALDDRGQVRARHGGERYVRVDDGEGLGVRAAGHRRRRREQADAPAARAGHRLHRLRSHDGEHVDAEGRLHHPPPQRGQRRRRGRVAGDDEQLDRARDELLGDLHAEALELGRAALAVGEARGVAEVHEVLVRQADEQLVQHGEAAHPGVEDADRPGA
jgi:hypothetical protein